MEKQRTYLTPEEVQEFIKSGVDFGETSCNWLRYIPVPNNEGFKCTFRLYLRDDIRDDTWDDPNFEIIPAPNLQEVLNVLPTSIENYDLVLDLRADFISYKDNDANIYLEEFRLRLYEGLQGCVIQGCVNLLRWVCKNYPETLTKN